MAGSSGTLLAILIRLSWFWSLALIRKDCVVCLILWCGLSRGYGVIECEPTFSVFHQDYQAGYEDVPDAERLS
jgi:hypothetical protein